METVWQKILLGAAIGLVLVSWNTKAALNANYQFIGNGNWSIDSVGNNETPVGDLRADVPPGSTVIKAFLYSSRWGVFSVPTIVLDDQTYGPDAWVALGIADNFLEAYRADVTAQVQNKIGSGSDSTYTFKINSEDLNEATDGEILAIVYTNSAYPLHTISLLDGYCSSIGETNFFNFASPLDTTTAGFDALMSLGIGFSYQAGNAAQYSNVEISGRRLTSAAGGQDDGIVANGGLITVGGIGDDPTNPSNPFAAPVGARFDDELYNLAQGNEIDPTPFIANGATSISISTRNPSQDDNIFFLGLNVAGGGFVDNGTNPPVITAQPQSAVNYAGANLSFNVTAAGTPSLRYQWIKDGTNFSAGTNSMYILFGIQGDDAGGYSVVVANDYGSVTSIVATLTVLGTNETSIIWSNPSGGNWNDAANWVPQQVPGPFDKVTVNLGVTIEVDSPVLVNNFAFANANLIGSGSLTTRGLVNWSSGTLGVPILVASGGSLNWSGGDLNGVLTVATGGMLTISNEVELALSNHYNGLTNLVALTNWGTVVWAGFVYGYGGAVIHNGGLWLDEGDQALGDGIGNTTNTFINTGTFQKTGGTGSTTIAWVFNTTGTVDVSSGALIVNQWAGTNILHGKMNLAGTTMNATLMVASNAVLNWSGGDLNGVLTVATGGMLTISNEVELALSNHYNGLTNLVALTNWGTVVWAGFVYGYGGAVIHNGGLWLDEGDQALGDGIGNTTNTFINTGTFQKTGGTGSTTIAWVFNSTGDAEVQTGTLALTGTAVQSSGITILKGGNLSVTQPYQLLGGVLAGTNVVTGAVDNNGGTVSPGASVGKLVILGSYAQTGNGVLQIELAGYSPGESFDQLQVTSTAQLAGTLKVTLTNGFAPTNGAVFTFLTAPELAGTFTNFIHPSNDVMMALSYTGTSASIQISSPAAAAPLLVSSPLRTNGDFVARFLGTPGVTYTIEHTTLLAPSDWLKLTNLLAPSVDQGFGVGVFELRDAVNASSNRFYRAVYPAY